jgi:xanthine dehydrogenase accessory factor
MSSLRIPDGKQTDLAVPDDEIEESRDTLAIARRWLEEFGEVALATVVSTWGSSPVPAGGQLAIAGERFEGSVSGGCVEVDVISEAADVMAKGTPRLLEFGVADETAWRSGLPWRLFCRENYDFQFFP